MPVIDQVRQDGAGNQAVEEEVTAQEACHLLGIGHAKLTRLLRQWESNGEGGLPFRRSALDHRVLLIKRSDIQALLERSQGVTVQQARRGLGISAQKMRQLLIEDGQLPLRENPLHRNKRLVDEVRYQALLAERRRRPKRDGHV